MSKYLAIDCESTGMHRECNILTVAFVVFDRGGTILDTLEVKILPRNGIFSIDPKAMLVNGIDLIQHLEEAEPLEKVQNRIKQFLQKHTRSVSPDFTGEGNIKDFIITERMTAVGSGIKGDIDWIVDRVFYGLYAYITHKPQCTVIIAEFLKRSLKLQIESVSLENLAKHFNIAHKPHNALSDAITSAFVYLKLLELNTIW